ncbi:hypothetical protein [Streptomyces sp. NPDC097610]|uniref:hypothetical protein n=1 Tax=Streptomyces sp. NPDC097610 TaxID=3157227 RepID=UPI00331CF6DE
MPRFPASARLDPAPPGDDRVVFLKTLEEERSPARSTSSFTGELGGGTDRRHRLAPGVGDWEAVTADLLQLIRTDGCDALSLGLPAIARALVCSGFHSRVWAYDPPAEQHSTYGSADSVEVLVEVGRQLTRAGAGCALWSRGGLLPPINCTQSG